MLFAIPPPVIFVKVTQGNLECLTGTPDLADNLIPMKDHKLICFIEMIFPQVYHQLFHNFKQQNLALYCLLI